MFNQAELEYILTAIDNYPVTSTGSAKNKAHLLFKISNLLEEVAKPKKEIEEEGEK